MSQDPSALILALEQENAEHANSKMGDNKFTVISSMITSVVSSLEVIQSEKDNIKEILHDLEANHGIKKKTAKKAAELIQDPEKLEKLSETRDFLDELEILLKNIKKM